MNGLLVSCAAVCGVTMAVVAGDAPPTAAEGARVTPAPDVAPRVERATLAPGTLFSVREGDDVLVRIDIPTFVVTPIGSLGVTFQFGGLAYDSSTDTLYMIDGRGNQSLYTVNTTTGAATLVGPHGIEDLFGLTYDPTTDTLFASGESPRGFYRMNRATGEAVFIGLPDANLDGLAYDCRRDQVVGAYAGPGDLFEINRANGDETLLYDGDFFNNCGTAYDPENDLIWMVDWSSDFYVFDPNNGYLRSLVDVLDGPHDGLAYRGGCGATCEPCKGDIDGDCDVDFDDLLQVLSGWGPCPGPNDCPNPGTCDNGFPECLEDPEDPCLCFLTFEGGGGCLRGSQTCNAPECPGGSGDCPDGWTCYVETCCGVPTCAPDADLCDTRGPVREAPPSGTRTFSGVAP